MPRRPAHDIAIHITAAAVITGVTLLLYLPSLDAPFVFDDEWNITRNEHIQVKELTIKNLVAAGTRSVNFKRPLANISFALNYYISEFDVRAYRVVNILIHIINGWLVYWFVLMTMAIVGRSAATLESTGNRNGSDGEAGARTAQTAHRNTHFFAFATALIWVVHPLQTQSVIYIVQRMNSMAVLFYLASLCLYIAGRLQRRRNRRWACFITAIVAWIAAITSKEIAATLPVVVILYEWFFFQNSSLVWMKRCAKYAVPVICGFGVVTVIYMRGNPFDSIRSGYQRRDFTVNERVLTQFRVVVRYLTLIGYPHPRRLNFDYDYPLSKSLFRPLTTLMSLAVIIFLFWLSWFLWRRRQALLSFCVLWFFIHLVIESSIIPLEIIYEHRTYLPSVGVLMALAYGFHCGTSKVRWLRPVAAVAVICVLAFGTHLRAGVWADEIALWRDGIEKSPNKARLRVNYGIVLTERRMFKEAEEQFLAALQMLPRSRKAHNNLGFIYSEQGRIDEAIHHLRKAIVIRPRYLEAHVNLGTALRRKGLIEEALKHYRLALAIDPSYQEVHFNLCDTLSQIGQVEKALEHCREATRLRPHSPSSYNALGQALAKAGDVDEAAKHLQRAVGLNADFWGAHHNLGIVRSKQGRIEEAIGHYRDAIRLSPDFVEAHNNLGIALRKNGRLDEAIEQYRVALSYDPDYLDSHNNLGVALVKQNRFKEALRHFTEALSIRPGFRRAQENVELVEKKLKAADQGVPETGRAAAQRHNDAGNAYLQQGELGKAIQAYELAIAAHPDFAEAHNNLGAAYGRRGNLAAAIEQFAAAVRISPDYTDAKGNLEAARRYKEQSQSTDKNEK